MLIFVDTEFTGLHEPYLVSSEMVTMDGRELYFEIAAVSPAVCCAFLVQWRTGLPLQLNRQPSSNESLLRPIHLVEDFEISKQDGDY